MHDVRPININVMHARLIQTRALQTRKLYPTKDYDLYAERKYVHCFCSVVQFVQLSVIITRNMILWLCDIWLIPGTNII